MSEKASIQPTLMDLKPPEEENEDEYTITEEREELMIPPNSDGSPTLRIAHFLKPLLNPQKQPLPKTPFSSLSSNPSIKELKKGVSFRGRLKPQRSWKSWVEDLQQTYKSIWKKVGIFDAIKGSNYHIKRDNELIMCLAANWCPETNTFVFSWGESTITLEDIMILGGFSVMGNSVHTPSHSKKIAKIEDKLLKSCSTIRRNCSNLVTHYGWMNYFMGKGGELEHVALLVLWLSRYVFPTSYIAVARNIFSIAIRLALGIKIALAPAILASIYRDLTILKEKIVLSTRKDTSDTSQLVLWTPFQLVQLWAWERFPTLSPKPACLVHGEPRMARWHDVKKLVNPSLGLDIDSAADSFIWRPYVLCLKNWEIPKFYCDEEMWVVMNSEEDEKLLSFVRCLRACELVGLDSVMQYLPHRVGMQFGLDQDIPDFVPRFNADYELAWSSYEKPIEGLKVYLPPRLFEGDVTVQYSRWWRPMLVVDDDALITYSRRKRSSRKSKRVSQLVEGGVGRSCTKAFFCSSFEGMTSHKTSNVVDCIASNTKLDETEKEKENMVDDIASNTELNEHNQDNVAQKEKGKMVDDSESNNAMDDQEDIVAEKEKGKAVYDIASNTSLNEQEEIVTGKEKGKMVNEHSIKLSTMARVEAVKGNLETKKYCSELADEHNHVGRDAIEVEDACNSPVAVEEENDYVKHFQERSLVLESRMNRLEKIVSMYKAAKFGSMVEG